MVIIDTDIIINHLRQSNQKETALIKLTKQKPKQDLAISVITVQELFEGQSTRIREKENIVLSTISPLKILPHTYETAKLAGQIARDLERPIELADAAIAATAIEHGAQLLTLNKKDFQGIKELELL